MSEKPFGSHHKVSPPANEVKPREFSMRAGVDLTAVRPDGNPILRYRGKPNWPLRITMVIAATVALVGGTVGYSLWADSRRSRTIPASDPAIPAKSDLDIGEADGVPEDGFIKDQTFAVP